MKKPLLVTSSDKIEGLLTIEKANKHKVGILSSISFRTFCALNKRLSKYDINYVILLKSTSWISPYVEPFTSRTITETDQRIVRGMSNYPNLVYTGNDSTIQELTLTEFEDIFPDDESLEEYKRLINSFAVENKKAFKEIKKIQKHHTKFEEDVKAKTI